jgi:hypothetical protein
MVDLKFYQSHFLANFAFSIIQDSNYLFKNFIIINDLFYFNLIKN